ncbi:hypothetical protein GOV09_03960 [Candidatus Woesearchaeota archaeon]|nr:hypothetical protein [Candidatus Woesearchaeota archaeon]
MLGKVFGIVMLPISILIILGEIGIGFSLPFNLALLGAILMIALQLVNMVAAKSHNGHLRIMQIVTAIFFIAPALALIAKEFFGLIVVDSLPLIVGVIMLAEALYALH